MKSLAIALLIVSTHAAATQWQPLGAVKTVRWSVDSESVVKEQDQFTAMFRRQTASLETRTELIHVNCASRQSTVIAMHDINGHMSRLPEAIQIQTPLKLDAPIAVAAQQYCVAGK